MGLMVRLLVLGTIRVFGNSLDTVASKFTRSRRSAKGRDWPSCQGHVESSKTYSHEEGLTVQIGYSYGVSGEYYAGYLEEAFYSDAPADRLIDALREGQEVTIRYNPSKPDRSLLLEEDQPRLRLTQSP
jgi:hypothetical protein